MKTRTGGEGMKIDNLIESLVIELGIWKSLTFDLMKFLEELKSIGTILNDFETEKANEFRKTYDYLVKPKEVK